jgi:hypothetical protein
MPERNMERLFGRCADAALPPDVSHYRHSKLVSPRALTDAVTGAIHVNDRLARGRTCNSKRNFSD